MSIRNAIVGDVSAIKRIADELCVDRNTSKEYGLVEYRLSEESYRKRILNNPFAFVSGTNEIVGFSIAYSSGFLKKLKKDDSYAASDEIIEKTISFPGPFIYLDQLCVRPEFFKKPYGGLLYYRTAEEALQHSIGIAYGAVALRPWMNKISLNFIQKHGWALMEEVTTKSGLTFGICVKEL